MTFFSDEAWFHLQGYINMKKKNCYWSLQNPQLTHETPLHPVKVGVWCALSARRTVGPVFFKETINCDRSFWGILFGVNRRRKTLWLNSARLSYCPHCTYVYAGFVQYRWGQNHQQCYLASIFT
jgi:hypothetical protein